MNDTIHENAQAAKTACEEYNKAICELQAKLGVWEENEDSCTSTSLYTKYRDSMGYVVEYCHS